MGGLIKNLTGGGGDKYINNATGAQTAAGKQAMSQLAGVYGDQKRNAQPWMQGGLAALGQMGQPAEKFNFDFQADPGYQFRLGEGLKAVEGSAAARGLRNSGATLKALTQYGQNFASNEYNNAYNRDRSAYEYDQNLNQNRLGNLANLGFNAMSGLNSAGGQYGTNLANITTGMGNAQAAGQMAMGQNRQNAMSGLMNLGGTLGAAAIFSDKRVKKDIKKISKKDVKEFKTSLVPYSFRYKDDKYGKGEWDGVMAQDLEKSKLGRKVVEESEGVKTINLGKLASLSLAMMAAED